ncbi:MAG TPA: hypothetical protein VL485_28590, partial [Ktedonobacteraceae bacterium]|nr:hypothetical protein [Ktedonobacteraceae bacterium]
QVGTGLYAGPRPPPAILSAMGTGYRLIYVTLQTSGDSTGVGVDGDRVQAYLRDIADKQRLYRGGGRWAQGTGVFT